MPCVVFGPARCVTYIGLHPDIIISCLLLLPESRQSTPFLKAANLPEIAEHEDKLFEVVTHGYTPFDQYSRSPCLCGM